MDGFKDERFSFIANDPRFRSIPKVHRRIKIDKRFQSMFTDKNFQLNYRIDKRGRPINETQSENFKKYYELSSSDEEPNEGIGEAGTNDNLNTSKSFSESEEELLSSENKDKTSVSDEEFTDHLINKTKQFTDSEYEDETDLAYKAKMTDKIKSRLKDDSLDYARGIGVLLSDSSSDESSSEVSDDENFEHGWGELDKNTEKTDEATRRFAVCHMDWDRINATDIMVLFHSFLPAEGVIQSVTIYPSEFGLQRMKDEEINGPKELTENSSKTVKENCGGYSSDEDAEGSKYHMEKLRQYQLNRLKYYYAVVVCNTSETANKLYLECDGMEYESSATKLDMRFIPDDMFFDQEPKDVCNRMPDLTKYSPRLFANTALQQIKVNLTWDETDPDRIDFNKKVISGEDMPDGNLKEYIATSSEEDNTDGNLEECENEVNEDKESICGEDKNLSKYRSLLAAIKDKKEKKEKGDVEMEITWEIGLRDKIDNQVEEKSKSQLTPFERIIQKKKERRRQKREISKAKDNDDLCSDNEIQSDVDLNDPFFNEMHKGKGKKKNVGLKLEETGDDTDQHKKELELLLAEDEEEEGKSHFNFKAIQDLENTSKKKRRKLLKKNKQIPTEDNFKVNVQDERFSALYNSHLFNIDPADSHYRKTKGMEEFIKEKLKRKIHPDNEMMKIDSQFKKPKPQENQLPSDLSKLVKSLKYKCNNV